MDRYIGKLLDNRYELQEVIGTGGMAVVYKARCHRLNRLVAVKVLKSELAQDAEFRRRFHDESQAVAMLSHPNIVAVYDVSKSDDLNYIVMELIDGITLKQYMQKKGAPLNWREALHFITQIMKALGHAHGRGIIHRDIKPHNIMVLRDGSVKVADFGIARLASATQSTLTQEALGSVHYISPEQARGSRVDERSDLYSAGVVLYEMITGRLPYEGDSPVSVAIQHINSIPLSPRELNPEIPEALEAITMKAMASNVSQRYESADAMLSDLEEFRKNPNINFDFVKENLFSDGNDEPTQVVSTVRGSSEMRRSRSSERKKEEGKRDIKPIAIAAGAITIFILGIVLFLWKFFFSGLFVPTPSYEVPNFVGQTLTDVYKNEKVMNKTFTIVEQKTSSDQDAGTIVKQDPGGGEQVKEAGTTITVYISTGAGKLTVPDMDEHTDQQTAKSKLTNMGLVAKIVEQYDDKVTVDYVISCDPEPGTEVAKGDTVTVYISQGPETKTITVGEYEGKTLEEATKLIAADGLVLGNVKKEYSPTVAENTVIVQDIAKGAQIVAGKNKINLTVSLGPDPATGTGSDTGTTDTSGNATTAAGVATSKTISVDLSGYSGTVTVRITVGGVDGYNNNVNADQKSVKATVTGTGTQEVQIYINNELKSTETVKFSS
jgi:serine/threonine protein kinase